MSMEELNPIEVLQRIYDSEVNARLGWFWDEGVEWRLGDDINGVLASGVEECIGLALVKLCQAMLDHFPESDFAKWIAPKRETSTMSTTWAGWEGHAATYSLALPPENKSVTCQRCGCVFVTATDDLLPKIVKCPRGCTTAV